LIAKAPESPRIRRLAWNSRPEAGYGAWCTSLTALRKNNGPSRSRLLFVCCAIPDLAASGSQGWGRAEMPEITDAPVELPVTADAGPSLLAALAVPPGVFDDASMVQGNYTLTTRGGRSKAMRAGRSQETDPHGAEGSVLVASAETARRSDRCGSEGFAASRLSLGFALAIRFR
jgi:hypothetical protein